MITIRRSQDRGHFHYDWLDTYHTFSFDRYYDPRHMGFRSLRVINEDRVEPGKGFPPHAHRDMEIITYILEGVLEHKDSLGNGSLIRPGEVQRMSAGTGVMHSEHNPSEREPVHLLQIWMQPSRLAIQPSYEQKMFAPDKSGKFLLLASSDGRDGSVTIQQDASLYVAALHPEHPVSCTLATGRSAWVQALRGSFRLNGLSQQVLQAGDGAAVQQESALAFACEERAEVLLFDLA
ncbi:MAG: pirin family protein [Acidobacteria bacterium]|nr:pirin family protein [Acidobacteriota bacterium]